MLLPALAKESSSNNLKAQPSGVQGMEAQRKDLTDLSVDRVERGSAWAR